MWSYGWFADYPDGDNFAQLLFGDNIHQSNFPCYSSPAYDSLYTQSRLMRDSMQRNHLFERMARQAETDAPWRLHTTSYRSSLAQPWVIGHKAHPFLYGGYLYLDIDSKRR
jgi:ABC-type oligopeptide transport system substrate-binding subunit